jgi:hypothetical protein
VTCVKKTLYSVFNNDKPHKDGAKKVKVEKQSFTQLHLAANYLHHSAFIKCNYLQCKVADFYSTIVGFILLAPFWLLGQTFNCFGIGYELLIFHRAIQFRRVLRGIPCTLAEL